MIKKRIGNLIMIVIIVAIAMTGIFYVGHIKGWFDKTESSIAFLTDIRGIVTIERDKVAYKVTEDTVLRVGDKLSCDAGATAEIVVSQGFIALGESASVEIIESDCSAFTMDVMTGEAFVDAVSPITLHFEGKQMEMKDAVASLSVRKGAQSISVFYGMVGDAKAGEMLEWIGEELSVKECAIGSLNAFNIEQMRKTNASKELVFSNEDLDALEAERFAQAQETTEETVSDDKDTKEDNTAEDKEDKVQAPESKENENETEKPSNNQSLGKNEKPNTNTQPEKEEKKLTCTITIRCDTILNNRQDLDPAKAPYVPSSGCVLPTVTVSFAPGETVFDVLNRVCKQNKIQIEYSWTPMYDSYYIEGINNLYEFDCGSESGWMYEVNGWFPNYGCSSYTLKGGETIVWCYTCKGLGEDVGAERWK